MACLCVWSVAYAQSKLKQDDLSNRTDNTTIYQSEVRNGNSQSGDTLRRVGELGNHSIRASNQISEEALNGFLVGKKSPLAGMGRLLLEDSPYWSTIIAICTIEEYSCSVNPYGSNNLGGLMSKGKLIRFDSLEDWIQAENEWLAKHEQDHPTIESLNCYYVQPCSPNWLNTVLKVKAEVENLE